MPELPNISTRPDLSKEFGQAVLVFEDWSPGHEGRQYLIEQKYLSIVELCRMVEKFSGDLPERVFDKLHWYMMYDSSRDDLRAQLNADPSYVTGARCLREMIERRKAAHR